MREREEDGERRGSRRRATLNQECVFAPVATATDMISTHKGKANAAQDGRRGAAKRPRSPSLRSNASWEKREDKHNCSL